MSIQIILNNNLNYMFLKKSNDTFVVVFSKNIYFKYKINNKINIYFNKNCKIITLKVPFFIKNIKKTETFLNNYNYSLLNYFFQKINFSGKSYKIKKKKVFIFEFNKAHIEFIFWKNFFFKKLKKTKMLLKSINCFEQKIICNLILNIRRINPFTRRGLRKSRDILKKKIGKKSN